MMHYLLPQLQGKGSFTVTLNWLTIKDWSANRLKLTQTQASSRMRKARQKRTLNSEPFQCLLGKRLHLLDFRFRFVPASDTEP